ncbi:MAG TPA: aminotransferase class V-fold PLP-dependent enzyme [Caulobacteraceae bacterium]|jgi:selenocysteine lyase/cysteine desulfurase|nr:aminotransferase class V-fold PLP-dependent enzyme [Caulobacteraceae bacterium]
MHLHRRSFFQAAGGVSAALASASSAWATDPAGPFTALPDRASFAFDGVHMNAAFTHMIGHRTADAGRAYVEARMREPGRVWPGENARNEAVQLYAAMINAAPEAIAVVPSTLEGENLVGAALGLGPRAGVVTDALHYDASLVRYGELARAGMPLTVLAPRNNRIDYAELDRAITPDTRLVAISLVSSPTGYKHDLERVCAIAHAKGAFVYADVIQAVGAIPFDVKASGVDFCCAGHYKWLMGEFGAAFLYVRPDRLAELKRTQLGWRGVDHYQGHALPGEPAGPAAGDWSLRADTAGVFEVSTASWGPLAATVGSLRYICDIGVDRLDAWRRPMLDRLQEELPRHGFTPLTPRDAQGPAVVFYKPGLSRDAEARLKAAKIYLTVTADKVRIAPSVHNEMAEVERVIAVLAGKA